MNRNNFYTLLEYPDGEPQVDEAHRVRKVKPQTTLEYINSVNIAEDYLDEDELEYMAQEVLRGLEEDKKSMRDWLDMADTCMDLANLKREEKNRPFRKASNIKYPLTSIAVIQFASRALPEMLRNGEVANYKVIGYDPDGRKSRRGRRNKIHINYQIMDKMPNWMDERDQLHSTLAVVGTCFTKTYYDPIHGVNRSETIPYDQLIVNNSIKSLEKAPRVSQYIYMTKNEIVENIRWGYFCDVNVECLHMDMTDYEAIYHELVEQHCYWDLDGDGYDEPVIVTVHVASQKVLRVVARYDESGVLYNRKNQIKLITPIDYFSDYHFIKNPNGGFFSIGFGFLLFDINSTVNTALNQLINAGHLATIQGGFLAKGLRIKKQELMVNPGEWITAQSSDGTAIKDNIVPFNYKEPSNILLQLIGMLIEAAKDLTNTGDLMTGGQDTSDAVNVSPNTIGLLQKEGIKVYTAIQRRIMRGYKKELAKLVRLNSKYINVEEYLALINPSPEELQEIFIQGPDGQPQFADYNLSEIAIIPVVDENEATSSELLGKSQIIASMTPQFAQLGAANPKASYRYILENMQIEPNLINQMVIPETPPQPPMEAVKMQHDMQMDEAKIQLEAQRVAIEAQLAQSKVELQGSQSVKAISDADASHGKVQLEVAKVALDHQLSQQDMKIKSDKNKVDLTKEVLKTSQKAQSDSRDHTLKEKANKQKQRKEKPSKLPDPQAVLQEALRRGWSREDQQL